MKHKYIKIIKISQLTLLITLINLLPIVYLPFLNIPHELPRFIIFGIISSLLVGLNVVYILISKKIWILPTPFIVVIGILIGSQLISTVLSISPLVSLMGIRQIYTGGLLYSLLLINILYTSLLLRRDKKIIISSLVLIAIIVSIIGLFEYIGQFIETKEWLTRPPSTIGHPVKLAFYLLSILPLCYGMILKETNKILKSIYVIGFLTIASALMITFTRSTYLVFILLLCLYIFFKKREFTLTLKKNRILSVVTIIVICVFGYITIRRIPLSVEQFKSSSFFIRLNEWSIASSEIVNRPILRQMIGFGPDTLAIKYNKNLFPTNLTSLETLSTLPLQIRNHYLNILFTSGAIGLLVYLVLLIYFIYLAFQRKLSDRLDSCIFLSVLGISIHSIFYYQTDNILVILWILLGLMISDHVSKTIIIKKVGKITYLLFLIPIVLIILFIRIFLAEILVSMDSTIKTYKNALAMNPFENHYRVNLGIHYFRNALQTGYENKDHAKKYIDEALRVLSQAYSYSKEDYKISNLITTIAYWAGINIDKNYRSNALYWAITSTRISQNNPYAWDLLGLVYLDQKRLNKALSSFEYEKRLNPESFVVYLHLGETYKQLGKLHIALKQYEKVLQFAPKNRIALNEINNINKKIKNLQ